MDLVLRQGESELPLVRILLHVVASIGTLAGGDQPGEIEGTVVPAEMIRELLRALGPQPAEPTDPTPPDDVTRPDGEPTDETEPINQADEAAPIDEADPDTPADGIDLDDEAGTGAPRPDPAPMPGWEQQELEDLERWWTETERRILSGEFGTGPDYGPDDGSPQWNPEPPPDWLIHDDPDGDAELLARQLAHPAAADPHYLDHDPFDEPPHDVQPTPPGPQAAGPEVPGPEAAGWWAEADRAVDEASLALLQAQRALADADRAVRTAATADADDETAWRESPGGRVTAAADALTALRCTTDTQRAWLAELLTATAGGGLADRPRLLLTDALTGALLALTDLPAMRRAATCDRPACHRRPEHCGHDLTGRPGLGPPGPTDGYRPSTPLDRFVRARDRRCRFPGCRRRVPKGGELDHNQPHPHGDTSAANLAGLCTGHHRGKHQAPGWRHDLAPDGTLTVTTPTGLTAVTTPPPY